MKSFSFSTLDQCRAYLQEHPHSGHIIFSGPDTVRTLAETANNRVILCATAGECTSEGYRPQGITGFTYPADIAEAVPLEHPPVKSIRELKTAYQKIRSNPNAFMLLLCDGLNGMEESIITTFYFTDPEFKIIGGSAGDDLAFKETPIFIGNRKVSAVAVLFNAQRRTQLVKENIYVPMGTRLLVTEADPIQRTVRTFDNLPASTAYAKALGISEKELPGSFMNHPLGKRVGDEIYIASPMKVNPDRSITFYSQIIPNTFIELLKPGDVNQILSKTVQEAPFKPAFLLSVNCILRSLKFQKEGLWKLVDSSLLGLCKNTTGFVSYGEQYYRHHLNQTMVLLLME